MALVIVKDFASETSIHGISYIFQNSTSSIKRVFWFVIVSLALTYAGNILYLSFKGIILNYALPIS